MAAKKAAAKSTPAPEAPKAGLSVVKAIKNSLFKNLAIGASVAVAGLVRATELDEGTYGTFTRFLGTFRAKVGETVYMAGKLYVPAVAESLIQSGFDAQREEFFKTHRDLKPDDADDAKAAEAKRSGFLKTFPGVEFGIWLEKTKDDSPNNKNGFTWTVKPMLDSQPPEDRYLKLVSGE